MSKPCLILLYIFFPQMSQATKLILDPGETIEQRIESILAIMSQDVTADDRAVLQNMLEQALEKKKVSQAQSFSDLLSKYGAKKKSEQEDVINVDESPEAKQSKPKKNKPSEKPTDRNTTQTKPTKAPTKKGTPEKSNVVVKKEDAKKVKGPPTKRKAPPSPEVSQEEEPTDSEYNPGNSNSDSDKSAPKCTPKRGRTKGQPKGSARKRRARGSRPPLSWCSSESEAESGDRTGEKKGLVSFTEEELKAMYDTAMDNP